MTQRLYGTINDNSKIVNNCKSMKGKPLEIPDDASNDKTINVDMSVDDEPIKLPDKMFEQTLEILAQTRTVNRTGFRDVAHVTKKVYRNCPLIPDQKKI